MGDLPHRVPHDPRYFTADVHITPDGRARIGPHTYSPEEYGDLLRRSGWDGRTPIRVIGCDAGSNDFADRLSRHTGADVLAPTKPAWTDSNGRVYTSDAEIGPDGNRQPRIPPNGEWNTHRPDGTTTRTGDDGFAPGTPDTAKHDLDPTDAKDRAADDGEQADQPADRPRSDDPKYDRLIRENEAIRNTDYTEGANRKIKQKWPQRTVSNGTATGTVNGNEFDESFAVTSGEERLLKGTAGENLPSLPPEGSRIFKTRNFDGTDRDFDSEPKAFEKLTRDILQTGSGQSRQDVENAIENAIKNAPKTPEGYPVNAKDVVEDAARQLGVDLDDISVNVDMVIDFPRGRSEGMSPQDQICGSCQDLMDDFENAFRGNVNITAKNLDDETMW